MSYFRFPNSVIDKVERWEQKTLGNGDTDAYNQTAYRYSPNSFTKGVSLILGILYIGAPIFGGFLVIHFLPLSANWELFCLVVFTLIITIASIVGIVKLVKRGHRL